MVDEHPEHITLQLQKFLQKSLKANTTLNKVKLHQTGMPKSVVFFNLLEVSPSPLEAEDPLQTTLYIISRGSYLPTLKKKKRPLTPLSRKDKLYQVRKKK